MMSSAPVPAITRVMTPEAVAPPSRVSARARPRWLRFVGIGLLLAVATLAISRAWPQMFPPPAAPAIIGSGRIEGREITLAPKDIQARVKRLLVDEGQTVTEGQLLAELDAPQIEARHAAASGTVANLDAQIAQASLDVAYTAKNSVASIAAAEAAVSGAQAHVVRARAVLLNARTDYERAVRLLAQRVISQRECDQVEMAFRTSEADVDAAEKDYARATANLALAHASADTIALKRQQVRVLQEGRRTGLGQLAEVQASLAERQVIAPANGTILSRPVEVGDVVAPGSPIFSMVDMSRLYLKVYIPEPEIAKLRLGDPAEISVDAFPNHRFPARISKIHDQAEFTPKNVETADERLKLVFGVELTFVTPDKVLKPGMPADCFIYWRASAATQAAEARHGS
jgi:HlyD family secretion protein